jgi:transmembrane sensor
VRSALLLGPAAQPFIVKAGSSEIQSKAAVVDIGLSGAGSHIEVRSGAVHVANDGRAVADLTTGEAADAEMNTHRLSVPAGPDWTSGMLQFDATPLASVVNQANRYSTRHIVLADSDLAKLKVTGTFRAGDVAGLAHAIGAAFDLDVTTKSNGDFILSASPEKKKGG